MNNEFLENKNFSYLINHVRNDVKQKAAFDIFEDKKYVNLFKKLIQTIHTSNMNKRVSKEHLNSIVIDKCVPFLVKQIGDDKKKDVTFNINTPPIQTFDRPKSTRIVRKKKQKNTNPQNDFSNLTLETDNTFAGLNNRPPQNNFLDNSPGSNPVENIMGKSSRDDEKIDFDDTAIVFPEPFGLSSDNLVPESDVIQDLNNDRSATVYYDQEVETRDSGFSKRKTDTQLQELFSIGGNFVNVTNFQVPNNNYDGEDTGGLRLDQRSGGNFTGNEIGKSKMLAHDKALNTIGKKFQEKNKVMNKQGTVHINSKISANFKADEVTLHVLKGTKVTDIIETVIIFSEYGQSIANYQKTNSKSPRIKWFRIHPQCWQLRDSFAFRKMNRHPRVYAYNVVPFQVHETAGGSMVDATAFGKGMDLLRQTVHKKYNYLYTGVNEDILNFDLNYQFSFFDLQRERPSSNSNSSIYPGQGVRIETDSAINRNSTVVLNPNKNEIKDGAGANETSSEDLKTPTMGLEFNNPAIQTAIQFNENIMNSQVDLLNLTLSIVGDTYFLPNSGMGNLVIQNVFSTNPDIEFGKREMDYLNGMCHVEVFFNTPVDIDEKTGDMKSAAIAGGDGTAVRLGTFSAIYRVVEVESTFRGGKFEQDLRLVAPQSLQIREEEKQSTDPKLKEKGENKKSGDIELRNDGFIESGSFTEGIA